MRDWFHAILEHLYNTFPLDHSFHNINDFLQTELNIDNVNGNTLHQLSAILSILRDKKYIDGLPQVKNQSELTRGQVIGLYMEGYSTRNSLLTHNVEVRLNIEGYVYMQTREMKLAEHKSIMDTNANVRNTNAKTVENFDKQNKLTNKALAIAIISAGITLGILLKEIWFSPAKIDTETKNILKSQQESIDSLKRTFQGIDTMLHHVEYDSTRFFLIGTKHK